MTLVDYKDNYDKLLAKNLFSKDIVELLSGWVLELIKDGQTDEAMKKMYEFAYRAFIGDQQTFEGFQFFSFRTFSDFSIKDIQTGKLSVCHPEEFNDPLDTVLFTYLIRKLRNEVDEVKKTQYCMLLKAAHQLRARCFVRTTPLVKSDGTLGDKHQEVSDINPLMWAHYAKYHTGFCSLYELNDTFVKRDDTKMSFTRMAIMKYEDTIDIDNSLLVEDALVLKNAIWKYEQEVRVLFYDPNNEDRYKELDAPPLKAVFLGVKCSSDDRHKMELALRRKNVELYQMRIDQDDVCRLKPERIG